MFWFGLFKIVSPVFRRFVYRKDYWNSIDYSSIRQERFINTYSALYYMNDLTDFNSNQNAFLMIDNETNHESLYLDPPDYDFTTSTQLEKYPTTSAQTQFSSMCATFKCFASFLEYLKENDVYDNTRIIIVSDHGAKISTSMITHAN